MDNKNVKSFIFYITIISLLFGMGCIDNNSMITPYETSNNPLINEGGLEKVELSDNSYYSIEVKEGKAKIGENVYDVLTFNGFYPGPLLVVDQYDKVNIDITNTLDKGVIIHWHGVIPRNKYDGSPVTQNEIKRGETFSYEVEFDYPGLYWYHSHLDESNQIYKGLFGGILVKPKDPNYYIKSDKEEVLMLKDLYIRNGQIIAPINSMHTDFMGWFGNTFTINGKTDYRIKAKKGEILKLYIVNTANARIFTLYFGGKEFLVFGSDLSRFEKPFYSKYLSLGPGERYTIYLIPEENIEISALVGDNKIKMGEIVIEGEKKNKEKLGNYDFSDDYKDIRENLSYYLEKDADFNHSLVARVFRGEVEWIIRDDDTGKENYEIPKNIEVGKLYKLKIRNPSSMMGSLPHPMHIHGSKMMLIKLNGEVVDNLVWKDTIIIPPNGEAEILFKIEKPGKWLYHCHILEHAKAGMMSYFIAS